MEQKFNLPEGFKVGVFDDPHLIELFENDWHTGQTYAAKPALQLRCVKCGSTQFEVGSSEYWTGIRCPNCKYEMLWHDG
jgi:DNA-directed RNA polymerase subunit RPC12/RpoP